MTLEYLTKDQPVMMDLLNRKLTHFLRAVKGESNKLHKADDPAHEFRRVTQKICETLDGILEDFRSYPDDMLAEGLNKAKERCVQELAAYPYFERQLGPREKQDLIDILKLKYVQGTPSRIEDGKVFRDNSQNAVREFAQLVCLFSKVAREGEAIVPILQTCMEVAAASEKAELSGEVVKMFPRLIKG